MVKEKVSWLGKKKIEKRAWLYTCNEGTFKVKLLRIQEARDVADIELLEPIPFIALGKKYVHAVGDVLHVGAWQVKEA